MVSVRGREKACWGKQTERVSQIFAGWKKEQYKRELGFGQKIERAGWLRGKKEIKSKQQMKRLDIILAGKSLGLLMNLAVYFIKFMVEEHLGRRTGWVVKVVDC